MTVDLYLIRHGLAGEHGSYANDGERPLTDEGKQKTRQVAERLHALKLRFDLILTSPLIRARQTADLLLNAKLSPELQESPQLAPGGSLDNWLTGFKGGGDRPKARLSHWLGMNHSSAPGQKPSFGVK